ncbi:hypothetical protein [Vulcanisaeta sp. JCM 16161]|uniref:hypothetical protein n=1 Tax=Vulcanisaeta sp. JCM 16161 TaxID=1295372 RepID=UPI00406CC717
MSASFPMMPGSTIILYYQFNGKSPRRKIPEGIKVLERKYYDLGSLLWFIEAWYWEPRDGNFYFEKGSDIHPKVPAVYLVLPPLSASPQKVATDGGSGNTDNANKNFTILSLILMPVLYMINAMISNVNTQASTYTLDTVYEVSSTAITRASMLTLSLAKRSFSST